MPRRLKLASQSCAHDSATFGPAEIQQDKLSVIGQMASSVAHELNNPLSAIVASVQTMLAVKPQDESARSLEEAFGPRAWEDLEFILSEALRAGRIVNGLLSFARHEKTERRPTAVMEILQRMGALSRNHLQACNVTLEQHIDDDIQSRSWGWVVGDANQLEQVLLNLVINAGQAINTAKTSGTISISARKGSDESVVITVEDDGPGVLPAQRHDIFEPFYTTKPAGQGTGLGLAISAGIIRAHGGDIWVEAGEEQGARFVITLPVVASHSAERNTEPTPMNATDQSPHLKRQANHWILLVDDDAAVRRSVSRFLRHAGYHVEAVSTGEAAVAMLRSRQFDAIISDLRMPGLSGEQLFHLVRCEFPNMAGRIVVTSGDMMREETRHFIQHSGCPALHKPYELTDLTTLLEHLCAAGECDGDTPRSSVVGLPRPVRRP